MPQGRITKRAVDALRCPAGKDRGFLWDDALAGFGVGAFPTGARSTSRNIARMAARVASPSASMGG